MFKKNDTIVFFGDSITNTGKQAPEGALVKDLQGYGFVSMINSYFTLYHPSLNLRIINQGISGNRSIDLINRFDNDVLSYQPQYMVIMIGINDAWRTFDCPQIPYYSIDANQYRENMEILINKAISNKINLILMTPFYLESNKNDPLRKKLDEFNVELKNIASQYNIPLLDLQDLFDNLLKDVSLYVLTSDRVHLNTTGHTFIKDQLLRLLSKYL